VTTVVQPGSAWVIGWDVGGAHVKACLLTEGRVVDVAQWACPLWQGMEHLDRVLDSVPSRWPASRHARHAVTMTGEMVDLFPNRREGVRRIAERLAQQLSTSPHFFAGGEGWCNIDEVESQWEHIASANWLATSRHAAQRVGDGVLIDIGSTTSDFIAFKGAEVHSTSRSDAQRLASGELVYHGVVRTPLCALARRIRWRDTLLNVMNEFFATSADVYRLTGELNPAHDLHPCADNGAKDVPGTQQRLARMVGLDAQDGSDADWLAFAHAWRSEQIAELAAHAVPANAALVSAGCGDFLVRALAETAGRRCLAYGTQVARIAPGARPDATAWAQVCAPAVAVATLLDEGHPP
jgi:probable H4MPT-linked C1 transfer pathway protein